MAELCPCGSTRAYEDCCGPFHRGAEPPTPETLMRSRFAAFAKRDFAYVWKTLHAEHAEKRDGASRAPAVNGVLADEVAAAVRQDADG